MHAWRNGSAVLLAVALGLVGLAAPSARATDPAPNVVLDARVLAARSGDVAIIVQKMGRFMPVAGSQ